MAFWRGSGKESGVCTDSNVVPEQLHYVRVPAQVEPPAVDAGGLKWRLSCPGWPALLSRLGFPHWSDDVIDGDERTGFPCLTWMARQAKGAAATANNGARADAGAGSICLVVKFNLKTARQDRVIRVAR
jgi:hypothetical protein